MSQMLTNSKIRVTEKEKWLSKELDELFNAISLLADSIGGLENFTRLIGEVNIERIDIGTKLGLAYKNKIEFSANAPVSPWSVVHELAHVWDAKHDWKISAALETYTGGVTDPNLSASKKSNLKEWDAGAEGSENKPGKYGRKPGVNKAGYFYGDKPSGSNWNFNRKEDFAEAVAMYCGWGRNNALSRMAHGRIERYLLPNGTKDPIYNVAENWSDYAKYFYPSNGDYTKTKRWQFITDLINNKIKLEK